VTGNDAQGSAGADIVTLDSEHCKKSSWKLEIGAMVLGSDRVRFRVWAPRADSISVRIVSDEESRLVSLRREERGYFSTVVDSVREGDRYLYLLDDGTERPDPASRFQPDGVHGLSQVVDPQGFSWSDGAWKGRPLHEYLLYELHVGTCSDEGTFEALIPMLDYLLELGITAIELMPVAQFPGERNWGYDGVYPFAPQNSYGGPVGLKKLIDACHGKGLAVVLDVVYNHLGPEGNYLHGFGPYFTDRYRTPWGEAVNFDGPYSDEVRRYFIDNALYWIFEYHVDALRLDAVHGIFDFSARHFLADLAAEVHCEAEKLGRHVYVIAESDLNDVRLIDSPGKGGYGLDGQWNDDFHHILHTLLTGEKDGYYQDFAGVGQLATAFSERFVYSGRYSRFRHRSHGNSAIGRPAEQFVVFAQNHDQVGNRTFGERLTALVSFESLKLAAGAVLLSPYLPLLFMGEEYGEEAPFLYFISHSDPGLLEAVREGRKEEFHSGTFSGDPPDPASIETFLRSKPDHGKSFSGNHSVLFQFHKTLIAMRKSVPALSLPSTDALRVSAQEEQKLVLVERRQGDCLVACLFNFNEQDVAVRLPGNRGWWCKLLDSSDTDWNGAGAVLPDRIAAAASAVMRGRSCAVYLAGARSED
jgi:maltooligosyltrehalose trehalohydrolase